ncbi:putative short chain dehydrogenase/reductase [Pestalotiopsis sp. NC0098]|nr:putative short chain dehydrogenase/reductase [Pestalotiopsis sp. NC0098]
MSIDKTIVLITGASSGIGLETVVALAKESPKYHVLLGSRSVEKGQKVVDEIVAADPSIKDQVELIQIDVTDRKSIEAAKSTVEAKFGKLDVLVNNAGIIVYRQDVDTLTSLREHFETNTFGTAICTEVFEPLLKKSSEPRLIHVSSDQGSIATRLDKTAKWYKIRGDTYRMSKAALNMLAACHKANYEDWGCKVCAFNPGLCVTNLTGEAGRKMRIQYGARDAKDAAFALRDTIAGKRDADIEKSGLESGIIDLDGGILPW